MKDALSVLLIGGGGREHALAWKIAQSPLCKKLYAAPGNPGIAQNADCIALDVTDHEAVQHFVKEKNIGLVVVGPEQPLVDGIADHLNAANIPVFGPSADAARLEGSKAFSKAFMVRHGIPTAAYASFDAHEMEAAQAWIEQQTTFPLVLKADGLAAGKGVFICEDRNDALSRLHEMTSDPQFAKAAQTVVIEEFMQGEEVSVFAICDGKKGLLIGNAQDHKRIGEGDTGLNTGGMGAYSPAPIFTGDLQEDVVSQVLNPTLRGLFEEGYPYVGVLYMGLMITPDGPKVVEYNCRFGDPECQVLMPMLDEDLLPLLYEAAVGNLPERSVRLKDGFAACVVMASEGYPQAFEKGFEITGLDAERENVTVFHSGTSFTNGAVVTNGGRVLCVTAQAATLQQTLALAYDRITGISFTKAYFRRDIGKKGLDRIASQANELTS